MMASQTSQVSYMISLAGIATNKKLSKQNATPNSVFCDIKLQEENNGKHSVQTFKVIFTNRIFPLNKENGQKTTLPELLQQKSHKLHSKFGQLLNTEKVNLLIRHIQSKAERDDTPKKSLT